MLDRLSLKLERSNKSGDSRQTAQRPINAVAKTGALDVLSVDHTLYFFIGRWMTTVLKSRLNIAYTNAVESRVP